MTCQYPSCDIEAHETCEHCGKRFCSDHGTKGHDIITPGYADGYHPAECWDCGGFSVDAE